MSYLNRTKKSQEMHAEQLLKLSTSLLTAFFISIFVVPIATVVGASFRNDAAVSPLDIFSNLFGSWYAVVFIIAEICIFVVSHRFKSLALSIYDNLYPDEEPSVASSSL